MSIDNIIVELESVKTGDDLKKYRADWKILQAQKNEIIKKVQTIANKAVEFPDDFEEKEDEFRDTLDSILNVVLDGGEVSNVWGGDYYDSWSPGEEIEIWIPSTC